MIYVHLSVLALAIVCSTITPASANSCLLPLQRKIKIACAWECTKEHRNYKDGLEDAAKILGYEVEFVNLRENPGANFDAVLSTGGGDIISDLYPSLDDKELEALNLKDRLEFGHPFDTEESLRDQFEYAFFKSYFANDNYRNIPALGICYGMQMLSIVAGNPLIPDIKHRLGIESRYGVNDVVAANQDSKLLSYGLEETFSADKFHHQALDYDYYLRNQGQFPFTVVGLSNNKQIVEIIEFSSRPAVGTQFHPERSDIAVRRPIFSWFLESACKGINLQGSSQKT